MSEPTPRITDEDLEQHSAEINHILHRIDATLGQHMYQAVDAELRQLDARKMPTVVILTWLLVTFAARDRLRQRGRFRFRAECVLRRREPDKWERLLQGL